MEKKNRKKTTLVEKVEKVHQKKKLEKMAKGK